MTAHTERRIDSTVSLAVALRLTHRDTLEAIAKVHPELPADTDTLTRAESMAVAELVCPERALAVFTALRADS
ncbi:MULTISPECIES: hypothetical protein [Pseudomonas]|uniref:hypothetical protein n=1 Tax=Pseudomonas TaxID=286 RepID=UPI001472C381|nr:MULTISPECIES: hypothetical protein [Pseudomonas]MCU0209147.1 hypothetical protein [Pseudomonas shahriarae]NMY19008.1 hypothetical protein [Pseudomonas sp. WS 5410]